MEQEAAEGDQQQHTNNNNTTTTTTIHDKNSTKSSMMYDNNDDDEEEECRVCRGPAEEGRKLFKPCMCSGSIGLVHQDCLESWLKVQQRRDGSCELCKTKFRFAPQYRTNTPDVLPTSHVIISLFRRAIAKWLPFIIRSMFAASLWLIVAPLITAYLYHSWMARPSILLQRMVSYNLLVIDLISGAVIAACIIVSFLSLMSFADFLRVEWQQRGLVPNNRGGRNAGAAQGQPNRNNNRNNNNNHNHNNIAGADLGPEGQRDANNHHQNNGMHGRRRLGLPEVEEQNIDTCIWDYFQNQVRQQPNRPASPRVRQLVAIERELDDMQTMVGTVNISNNINTNNTDDNGNQPNSGGSDVAVAGALNRINAFVDPFADAGGSDDDDDDDDDNDDDDDDDDDSWNEDEDDDEDSSEDDHNRNENLEDEVIRPIGGDDGDGGVVNQRDNDDGMPELEPLPIERNNNNLNNNNNNLNRDILRNAIEREVEREPQQPRGDRDGGGAAAAPNNNDNNNAPNNNNIADFDQEDPIDMDINIALDELLGVRGPLMAVARNLLWLLAFNAVFLGFFAFVPRTVGVAMSSILFNTTLFSSPEVPGNTTADIMNHYNITQSFTLTNAWKAIDAESIHQNTALRLHDLATVTLGYFSLAFAVIFFRFLWVTSQKVPFFRERTANPDIDEMREALDEMNRIVRGLGDDLPNLGDDPPVVALSLALGVALDAMLAIVKVGILLFLKMFLLPIVLGLTLDATTIPLFGSTVEARVAYAGLDLFSFILLHWVAGITFMLLVTVSVLQLREVVHPDILAQVIRPQEPQPDLLGNLMHESVGTHAKRMVLSLIIYAFLLTVHIYVPVLFYNAIVGADAPYFKMKLAYILTPQLQVPLELLFFHLCMLALLEKYKNCLGGIQHHWLKFMTELIGLSDRFIPKSVEYFRCIGSRTVFESGGTVDPFWFELSNTKIEKILSAEPLKSDNETIRVRLIDSNLHTFEPDLSDSIPTRIGETKPTGERVLGLRSDYIKLPIRLPGKSFRARSTLLPTKIGKYRLKCESSGDCTPFIQLWEEVPGISISRPPEGWDDLGAGGADVQGRWAWGNEKKSTIEGGIAVRRPFFHANQGISESLTVVLKLLCLAFLSWFTATLVLCTFLTTPLLAGRSFYYILRLPESWVHDPMAFCIGFLLLFPIVRKIASAAVNNESTLWERIVAWMSHFHLPSPAKIIILAKVVALWFIIAPLLLGFLYDVAFVKSVDWFKGDEPFIDQESTILSWILGSLLLYVWADLCILGVLTKEFRIFGEAREAGAGRENAANDEAAAWFDAGGGRLRLSWQGKHGRMARFWNTFNAVLTGWEWDKVDEVNLVHNCAAPVAFELLLCLCIPLALLKIISWRWSFMSGLARTIFVRSVLALYCSIQLGFVWKDQLMRWFEAAHKTARDDRYLIGEILLNYGE